jgi:hypothetical protein
MIGDINQIDDPENYHLAVKGIAKLVEIMLSVGANDNGNDNGKPAQLKSDGNTILSLFGPWLFQSVKRKSPE